MRFILYALILLLVLVIFMRQKLYRSRLEDQSQLECGWDEAEFAKRMGAVLGLGEADAARYTREDGRSPAELAEVAWRLSLEAMGQRHPDWVRRREKALKRAQLLPAFAAVVAGMALIGMKTQPKYLLLGWLVFCVLVQIPAWTSQGVDREAAKLASEVIKQKRLFARIRDEEKVLRCLQAMAWKRLLPFG